MAVTRRTFTRSLAGALLAGPFLGALTGRAQAQEGGAPAKRLLVFYSPNGTLHRFWRPDGTPQAYRFTPEGILGSLEPRRSDLLLVDGLNFVNGDNHEGGQAAMLTNGGGAGTPTRGFSLDQFVADRIGASDRFKSLELGVLTDIWGANRQTRISYRGPDEMVHPDADPRRVFERLFGAVAGGPEGIQRVRALRQSVLDLAKDELADIHRRVGRAEQLKLEAHLGALRSVEQQLFAPVASTCEAPVAPDPLNKDTNDNVPALMNAQIEMAVQALGCGLSKVVTLQLSHTVSPVVFTWLGHSEGHHSLSHAGDSQTAQIHDFVAAEQWVAGRFGHLLDRLEATPDPDEEGRSLLDTTLVVWAKELGDPRAHVCREVPFVLAGGGVRGGRWLQVPGQSHARLLLSACHQLGVAAQTFGDPQSADGPLQEGLS